jgi:replicative DNA helicase
MAGTLKDKVPPHNLDAEQATLGALLLDWDAVDRVVVLLKPEQFYLQRNRIIYKAILSLAQKGQRGDILTLTSELRSSGELDSAGGEVYISSLTDTVPTSANVEYYAQVVRDAGVRRELILAASQLTADAHDETKSSEDILEEAQKKIFALTELGNTHDILDIHELVQSTIDVIEKHSKREKKYSGVPTGFDKLDQMTDGFQAAELIIIGARPSMGKTALALSMVEHIVLKEKIACGFFSLEMSALQIMQRLLAQESSVPSEKIRAGLLSQPQFQSLSDAAGRLFESSLHIVDASGLKLFDLRTLARRMVSLHQVKIIFIDYIGLIAVDDALKMRQRWEQVAEISRSLKALARELNIPIVALSQVSRDSEKGKAGPIEPGLGDLRDSGAIEQDADVVILIHGERKNKEEDADSSTIERSLILAKQRNGPTGLVKTIFHKEFTKFVSMKSREQ